MAHLAGSKQDQPGQGLFNWHGEELSDSQGCCVCISGLCWTWSKAAPAARRTPVDLSMCWIQPLVQWGQYSVWTLKFLNNVDISQLKEHIKDRAIFPPFQRSHYITMTKKPLPDSPSHWATFLAFTILCSWKKNQTKISAALSQY